MSRIAATFSRLQVSGTTALIPFMTAGHPHPDHTVALMHGMVAAGANLLELGVPFSDPMADGPVIQRANELALEFHVTLDDVLSMVQQFRQQDATTPVILMGYLNPIEVMGYERFAAAAAAAGVDGVITVDLPPEEGVPLLDALQPYAIDTIYLIAPTTNPARIAKIAAVASGFIYYVSMKGITGAGGLDFAAVEAAITGLRQQTTLPLGVGFGIKSGTTAAAMAAFADAVVVGSALVEKLMQGWESSATEESLLALAQSFIRELRAAMDGQL
ncbi:MAG: tryptophan synthase subunit alpha [Gammaproteobacteria bacterium]|nr:tryptophan synthase subunit alpha [Gammaproteobacteria bacterium]